MFSPSFIKQLKQSNISSNEELTKERCGELWKSATTEQKNEIENLAGCTRATIYRAYNSGSISVKLVIPFAQVLDADPYYLLGEADRQGEYDEDEMRGLLRKLGYGAKLDELEGEFARIKPRRTRRKSDFGNAAETPPAKPEQHETTAEETEMQSETHAKEHNADVLADNKETESVAEPIFEEEKPAPSESVTEPGLPDLCEDDVILLMRSVMLRAKAGIPAAVKQAAELKRILFA